MDGALPKKVGETARRGDYAVWAVVKLALLVALGRAAIAAGGGDLRRLAKPVALLVDLLAELASWCHDQHGWSIPLVAGEPVAVF